MIPPLIVEQALTCGIDLIAITDHNTSLNYLSVKNAAEKTSLIVLPGMELQTKEDVHVLCLFDKDEQITLFQKLVDDHLPDISNQPEHLGEQFIVDETGEFIRREERMMLNSTSLSIGEAFNIVESLGGILIPAHVNRKAFGLIENLGFVPMDLAIPAVEISRHLTPPEALKLFPQLKGFPIIQNGDVHRLDEFLGTLTLTIAEPTISEVRLALSQSAGRTFTVSSPNITI